MRRLSFRQAVGRGPLAGILRLALLGGSLALLWRAERAHEEWERRAAVEFQFKNGLWFAWIAPALVAGIVFGLALWLPRGRSAYRWGRSLLLGVPPLLLVLHYWVVFGLSVHLPGLLGRPTPFWESGPQFALVALSGIAITSGFAEADEEP